MLFRKEIDFYYIYVNIINMLIIVNYIILIIYRY